MVSLEFLVHADTSPALSLAADAHAMHVATRPSRHRLGTLRVFSCSGAALSLGRYHICPDAAPTAAVVTLYRRFSGGRVVPFGDGFVGISLVLPHRAAAFSDDPLALAPYQVMNRYVRGIIEACRLVNVSAFYPGRDWVTVNRRLLAFVSFEVAPSGALLFEAILANHCDFGALPGLLDTVDPHGVMKADLVGHDSATSLAREFGTTLSIEEIADLMRRGFERQFQFRCDPHTPSLLESHAIEALALHEFQDRRWLRQRHERPDLDRVASTRAQLGTFEAYFSLAQDRFIKDIMFAGDFIANSAAIERLERGLRLCPAEWRAIDAVASEIFAQPENYILGIGPVRTIADTIAKALPP